MFVQIIECILPLDYYTMMAGVLVDQEVFFDMMQTKLPKLYKFFRKIDFDPKLVVFQWFVCMFSSFLDFNVSIPIYDYFMLKGVKVTFLMALSIFQTLQKCLLGLNDFGKTAHL